ncbi:DUF2809 domain-containing protein [Maribacter sp. 2-571]|uniref:ribosomal maturation YjgA family protein n=1 Tax=Maribacter sp. 2-571 TaxID=3417569 RepID=UPI003D34C402
MPKRPNTFNLLDGYHRKRPYYGLLVVLTIGAGLLSRTPYVPALLYPYIGDVLYALMMYFLVGFCAIRATPLKVAVISLAICFGIEFGQLKWFKLFVWNRK